tara:strand:+ start:391 stop:654 length:264 start_codon:yes stop_codon:yes gene_type:complete
MQDLQKVPRETKALLQSNKQSAARVIDETIGTAILYLERLNGEHHDAIGKIPSVRNVASRIPEGNLFQWRKWKRLPLGPVAGGKNLA